MSDELKIAALSLLLNKDNQKPLPQVMQDVAFEWLAERDTTPVDAEWLDGVLDRREETGLYIAWNAWRIGVTYYKESARYHLELSQGSEELISDPTRGDVLTALRLFGG